MSHHPFWHANKPYLDTQTISDARFRSLGYVMAMLAGAINAGGFVAVHRHTSHVTGALSRTADLLLDGEWRTAAWAMTGVICFILGAAHSNWTILWIKRQRGRSSYGVSMWLEAIYLLISGLLAVILRHWFHEDLLIPAQLLFLCFIMGMHNTVMTVLSGSAIRSTHMTGTATDLGIELSKILYYRRVDNPRLPDVNVNRPKMRLLIGMMVSFVVGGVIGTWGYRQVGYHFTIPIAAMLFLFGAGSIGYDMRLWVKWRQHWRKYRR